MLPKALPADAPSLVAPTVEAWKAMTSAARERYLVQVNDSLSGPQIAMSEGRSHKKAKTRTLDRLGLHFSAIGRVVYLAEEMAVVYPGESPFSPDVLAVLDVPEPEEDERLAWVVADEGKGIDLALEVLHHGDRHKDLVRNVERYARLRIPEYFVYDRARQQIHGYRLATTGAPRYQPIVPQAGRYTSAVLGLDFAILGGTLRLFHGASELAGTGDVLGRLQGMVNELTTKVDETAAQAEQAAAQAQQAAAQAGEALAVARAGILAVLEARGVPCPDEVRALIMACEAPAILQQWLVRAIGATSASAVVEPG
jgi:Uma2 family endonuclease